MTFAIAILFGFAVGQTIINASLFRLLHAVCSISRIHDRQIERLERRPGSPASVVAAPGSHVAN